MPYNPHGVVKPQDVADTFVTAVAERLVIANTFSRFDAKEYLGKAGDTITKRVKGTVPFRRWGFKNDRREPLRVDRIDETTVNLTVGAEWLYSGLEMTPEQREFDFGGGFGDLFNDQVDAIVQGFEHDAFGLLTSAPYERVKVIDNTRANVIAAKDVGQDHLFNQFVDLKADLKRMRSPEQNFICIAGADLAGELVKSNKLLFAAGQNENSAFANAVIGTYAGITFVEGPPTMAGNEGYLYASSGYLLWNAAPPIPNGGGGKYAQSARDGVSMLWIQDHDNHYMVDRSVFATWKADNYTKDFIALETGDGRRINSESDYFLRGVKVILNGAAADEKAPGDGKTDTPGGNPNSILAAAYRGELAAASATEGALMPFWLRQGSTTENDVVSKTTNADGTVTTTYSDGSTTTA